MNFTFLFALLLSVGLAAANWGQLLGIEQQQCPPCICNTQVSQSQAQSQAQNQGGGGGGGGGGYPRGGWGRG